MKKTTQIIRRTAALAAVLALLLSLCGCGESTWETDVPSIASLSDVPAFSGEPYVEIAGNVPTFMQAEITTDVFEEYSELDDLGRCGVAYANICKELMPTEKRGEIGMIKPSGWHTVRYDDLIHDKYLYNRCHLIGFQLAGENANEKNLITGTRYMNVDGMLPFENAIADYVKKTDHHVLYRVTPVFEGDNLVASGVVMEAYSVEDDGEGVSFHVYCYNNQPGIEIDYSTGESWVEGEKGTDEPASGEVRYILNKSSGVFHNPSCSGVQSMKPQNRVETSQSRSELTENGYKPCGVCKP